MGARILGCLGETNGSPYFDQPEIDDQGQRLHRGRHPSVAGVGEVSGEVGKVGLVKGRVADIWLLPR